MKLDSIGKRHFQNIQELSIPPQMREKYKTKIEYIDKAFAGFTPGTVGIFTGAPGAGKTTLMLAVADALGEQNINVAYNSAEEDIRQLKMVTERLQLESPFFCGNIENIEDVIIDAKKNEAKMLIIDSLQTIGTRKHRPGSVSAMRDVAKQMIDYCKDNFIVGLMIGHVTKDNKIGGPNTLKHLVDCHIHLDLCVSPRCTTCEVGTRILCSQKNRFGPAGIPSYLMLGLDGFYEIPQKY